MWRSFASSALLLALGVSTAWSAGGAPDKGKEKASPPVTLLTPLIIQPTPALMQAPSLADQVAALQADPRFADRIRFLPDANDTGRLPADSAWVRGIMLTPTCLAGVGDRGAPSVRLMTMHGMASPECPLPGTPGVTLPLLRTLLLLGGRSLAPGTPNGGLLQGVDDVLYTFEFVPPATGPYLITFSMTFDFEGERNKPPTVKYARHNDRGIVEYVDLDVAREPGDGESKRWTIFTHILQYPQPRPIQINIMPTAENLRLLGMSQASLSMVTIRRWQG